MGKWDVKVRVLGLLDISYGVLTGLCYKIVKNTWFGLANLILGHHDAF